MAEINIEKKEGRSGLWIIIGLLVLALGAWWLFRSDADVDSLTADADSAMEGAAATTSEAAGSLTGNNAGNMPAAVQNYLTWSDERQADPAMTLDHQYTATGIRHLADALSALAVSGGGANVQNELNMLRSRADTLGQNANATTHANHTRAMFQTLSGLMTAMQQERFPDMANDVQSVERAAQAVRADQQLLQQREAVKNFFDSAATAVRRMAEQR